jgi:hypothetical protein
MRIASFKLGLTLLGSAALLAAGGTAGIALGSASRAADGSPIQQALQKMSKVASGHFSFTAGITGGRTSKTGLSVDGTGGFDTKHQASTVTLNLGALASVLGGAAGGISVPKSIGIVTIKNVLYAHIPSVASQLTPGKEWLRFDSTSIPTSVTGGVQASQIDPQKALATLTASVSVHKLGSAKVRGSSTTHYLVTIGVGKLVTILPKAQQAAELKALQAAGIKNFPIDVYVDGSGYVRRVAISLSNLKVQKGSAPTTIKLSVDLYDFGHPVHAAAPPASRTADGATFLSAIVAGLGGGSGG